MALGDVYQFDTDQAQGYDSRSKFHIELGVTDHFRAPDRFVFLFISSGNYGGTCFPVMKADYEGFLDHDSFISCGKLVYYSLDYLKAQKVKKVGKISPEHLMALRNHLVGHEVMPEWEINIACAALAAII